MARHPVVSKLTQNLRPEIQASRSWEAEAAGDFLSDFVAACADTWTDGCRYVDSICSEFGTHASKGSHHDTVRSPPPSRMNRGNRLVVHINQQHRKTIRRAD